MAETSNFLGRTNSLVTGRVYYEGDAIEFAWEGNDEMEVTGGHGWAELQDDGSLERETCLQHGDEIPIIARRATTSSTAC